MSNPWAGETSAPAPTGGSANPWGGSSSAPASTPASAPAAKSSSHSSFLGAALHDASIATGVDLAKHFGKDVAGAVTGTIAGAIPLAKAIGDIGDPNAHESWDKLGKQWEDVILHPRRVFNEKAVKADPLGNMELGMAKQEKNYWLSPHVLSHVYDHPLQGLVDLSVVYGGGVGAAAAAGRLARAAGSESKLAKLATLSDRGEIVTRSPRQVYQGEGPKVTDLGSDRPGRNLRERTQQKLSAAQPDARLAMKGKPGGLLGYQGELKRWGSIIHDAVQRNKFQKLAPFDQYAKVVKSLKPDELTALNMRAEDVHPDRLAEYWKDTKNPDAEELTPKVRELMLNPSKRMIAAEPVFRSFSGSGAELSKNMNKLSAESELERPGLAKRLVAKKLGVSESQVALHGDPYYFPHTHIDEAPTGSHPLASVGGGKGPPKPLGSTKQNRGILFSMGKVRYGGDVMGPEFLRRIKSTAFSEIHQALVDSSVRKSWDEIQGMPRQAIPKGWEFMRPDAATHNPYSIRPEGREGLKVDEPAAPTSAELAHIIPDLGNLQSSELVKQGFTTDDIRHALADENGNYHLIPKATARAASGEFTRLGRTAYIFNKYPVRIWRALLLGTRPAFLVNNMVGNGLMYAVKVGGTGALRDFVMAVAEHHGVGEAEKLIDDPVTPPALRAQLRSSLIESGQLSLGGRSSRAAVRVRPGALTQEGPEIPYHEVSDEPVGRQPVAPPPEQRFYSEHYPEQMPLHGSFGYTQVPGSEGYLRDFQGKVGRGFGKITGAIPHATAYAAEGTYRRALIRNYIRRSPEFKRVYSQLPKDERTFLNAAEKLHKGEGGIVFQRMISKEVDRSIGNYTRLSPAERGVLRTAFPFYAWYRAILTTTFHLATDNPLRTYALYQLGQIGGQYLNELLAREGVQYPSYLQGGIPLGSGPNGTQRVYTTAGLNPWSTIQQLVQGSTSDVSSLGLNPFFDGILQEAEKESAHGGHVSPGKLLGHSVESIFTGLPTTQLVDPSGPSALYPNRGTGNQLQRREAAFLAWLGAPIKEVDPTTATTRAQAGQ